MFMAMILVCTALALLCAVQFFRTEDVPRMMRWGGGLFLCFLAVQGGKNWYWMQLERLAMVREIKRVELLVAQLAVDLRGRAAAAPARTDWQAPEHRDVPGVEQRYTSMVSTTAEEVLKEALQLSQGERARVAAELLASLDPDIETREGEAWIAEVERRAQAAIDGLPGLTWDETRTRVEERIARTHK